MEAGSEPAPLAPFARSAEVPRMQGVRVGCLTRSNSGKVLVALMFLVAVVVMFEIKLPAIAVLQFEEGTTLPGTSVGNTTAPSNAAPCDGTLQNVSEVVYAAQVDELVSSCAPSSEPSNFTCPAYLAEARRGRSLRFAIAEELPWFKRKSQGGNSSEFFEAALNGRPAIVRVGTEEDFDFAFFYAYGWVYGSDIEELLAGLRASGKRAMVVTTADMDTVPLSCAGGHVFFSTNLRLSKDGRIWGSVSKPHSDDVSNQGVEPCFMFQIPYPSSLFPDAAAFARKLERPRTKLASFSGTIGTYVRRSWIEGLKDLPDVSVRLVNWWAPDVTSEQRSAWTATFYRDLNESTFGLCPRGNGYSSMRFIQTVGEGTLPVMMDDWILPYGESMCSFAIRTRLEGDHDAFVRDLRELAAHPDRISKRWNNMKRFVECYWPNRDIGLSAPFVLHVARRAISGDLSRWICSTSLM